MTVAVPTSQRLSTLTMKPFVSSALTVNTRELDLRDRCDRCGSAAFVRAQKQETGSELLFCGYHARKNLAGLQESGWMIDDQTYRAFNKPTAAQTTD